MKLIINFSSVLDHRFNLLRVFNVALWKIFNCDQTLNVDYPLNSNSIVFDVGGYVGNWTEIIYKKYGCNIYVFEPVPEFSAKIKNRFKKNKKIRILTYGLAGNNSEVKLHVANDSTSEFGISDNIVQAKLINVKKVLDKLNIKKVDLISINIEGGEYDLLDYLIKAKLIKRFKKIQIQFHPFVKHAFLRMNKIQKELKKTHKLTYKFSFVWENWSLK